MSETETILKPSDSGDAFLDQMLRRFDGRVESVTQIVRDGQMERRLDVRLRAEPSEAGAE